MIGLINYGGGNYKSVSNALEYLNINYLEINSYHNLKKVDHIILPGVGVYNDLISTLKSMNIIDELIYHLTDKKKFYIGICVGMQILSESGLENNKTKGLNLIKGKVEKIPVEKEALPNIGWHNIILEKKNSLLFKNIDDKEMLFYFVHSYYFNLDQQEDCSSSIYYEKKLTASVEKDNIFGVQFHPEKSQAGGLKILKNFCNL
jgi:glutamine amidotransferase